MDRRNRVLWIIQWVFGVIFILVGVLHFIVPEGLPGPMSWMYDLSDPLHTMAGTAEILGGLGLILPGLTRIRPALTVFAAAGLMLVMVGAAAWHGSRGEVQNVVQNLIIAGALTYVAYGRWKLSPLPGKQVGNVAQR
jgi:putative oxidoreductase